MNVAFEQGIKYFSDNAGSFLGGISSHNYVNAIENQLNSGVDNLIDNLYKYVDGMQTPTNQLQGNVFERLQAGTFNIRADLHNSDFRAAVLNSTAKDSPDVRLTNQKTGGYIDYSMKSNINAKTSLNELSKPSKGGPHSQSRYHGMGKIMPDDQIDKARKINADKIEHVHNKDDITRFKEVEKTIDSKMSDGKRTHSSGTSRSQNQEITEKAREKKLDREELKEDLELTTKDEISATDIMGKAFKAGLTAATISFVISMAPTIINGISMLVSEGEIDPNTFTEAGINALPTTAKSFLSGSVTAAIVAACEANQLNINPSFVSTAVVLAVGTIISSAKFATGKITKAQMADEIARMHITTAFAVGGGIAASVWFVEIPPLATAAYMLGSLIGGVIGSFAYNIGKNIFMSFCIESGCTFFGLVDQNYELPQEIIEQIGIEVFDYEKFNYNTFQPDTFQVDTFSFDTFEYEKFGITILRRGVIGIGKIGYT